MYTTLGATNFVRVLLLVFGLFLLVMIWGLGLPSNFVGLFRTALLSSGLFVVILLCMFGSSSYWSPWRIVWRIVPSLNRLVFPDLNGVWRGKALSNWPVLDQLRHAASSAERLDLHILTAVPLLERTVTFRVRASLFNILVQSTQENGGETRSNYASLEKNSNTGEFDLSYIYSAVTPEPAVTDEGSHQGAIVLTVKWSNPPQMRGQYWTRRKWREGSNTAGRIDLLRVSRRESFTGLGDDFG